MIDYIQNKMKAADFETFKRDYDLLWCVHDSEYWKESVRLKNKSIYKRKLIDMLSDIYEYNGFRSAVYNNEEIHQ